MTLLVKRLWPTDLSTCGELWVDGQFFCYTLEPPIKTDGSKPRAIDPSTYQVVLAPSRHFGTVVPHVQDVPDFEGIEIHWGNSAKDTDGCLLVGKSRADNWVGFSKEAWGELMVKMAQETLPALITYLGPPQPEAT